MSYAIFALALLALFHFIYEAILAPSFRMRLRFELCALQDELRRLRMGGSGSLRDEHYQYLHDSLSALMLILHRFDAATLVAVEQEIRHNPELRTRVELRERVLDGCRVPEVLELRRRSLRIAAQAIAVNHGGWCVYGVPLVLAYLGLDRIRRLIRAAASLSKRDFVSIAPEAGRVT